MLSRHNDTRYLMAYLSTLDFRDESQAHANAVIANLALGKITWAGKVDSLQHGHVTNYALEVCARLNWTSHDSTGYDVYLALIFASQTNCSTTTRHGSSTLPHLKLRKARSLKDSRGQASPVIGHE